MHDEIDKSPKVLFKITAHVLVSALTELAKLKYQINSEKDDYDRFDRHELSIQDGIIQIGKLPIYSWNLILKSVENQKPTKLYFTLPLSKELDYENGYKKTSFKLKDMEETTEKCKSSLSDWQDSLSKNERKRIHKLVEKFNITKSPESCIHILKNIHKMSFNETPYRFSFITCVAFVKPIESIKLDSYKKQIQLSKERIYNIEQTILNSQALLTAEQSNLEVLKRVYREAKEKT